MRPLVLMCDYCMVRHILMTYNANQGHYKKECTSLLKHALCLLQKVH